jgi:putative ABC transport system permease protein
MFLSLLITFYRNARRSLGSTVINLLGLSIGLTAGILILLYVFNEYSYDRFHRNYLSINRVNLNYANKDGDLFASEIPAVVGPSLLDYFAEIQSFCRVSTNRNAYFKFNDKIIDIENVVHADSNFFQFFSFQLLKGTPADVLHGINKVVLTDELATNLFGKENPIGKVIVMNGNENWIVTGIAKKPPQNSSIQFDALLSFETLYADPTQHLGWNGGNQYQTYITVNKSFNKDVFDNKLEYFLDIQINRKLEGSGFKVGLMLEPIQRMHLYSLSEDDSKANIAKIRIFSLIAVFILLIACFNFTNMAAASAIYRAKETGIRKVLGATRSTLFRQYLGESIMLCLLAAILALLLTEIVLPYYNALIEKDLSFYHSGPFLLPLAFIMLVLFTGFVSGIFPAMFLSAYQPIVTLKGGFVSSKNRHLLPKILVIIQFALAVGMLNSIWIIKSQLKYISDFKTGFNTENVIAITLPSQIAREKVEVLKQAFLQQAGINQCGATVELPGAGVTMNGYLPETYSQPVMIHVMDIDASFVETMGMEVVEGRNFDEIDVQKPACCLVNEAYVHQFIESEPIGKKIERDGNMTIIGVLKDFHFASLHQTIAPLILTNKPYDGFNFVVVRTAEKEENKVIDKLEKTWFNILPNDPFVPVSMSSYLQRSYVSEMQLASILSWFTFLAVFIAVIGLLGLSSLILRLKTKELGIRKILGASTRRLVFESLIEFSILVLIANVLAIIPVVYFIDSWLGGFSYTISISPVNFALTFFITLVISWISVGWQAIRAAQVRTIEIIKYE